MTVEPRRTRRRKTPKRPRDAEPPKMDEERVGPQRLVNRLVEIMNLRDWEGDLVGGSVVYVALDAAGCQKVTAFIDTYSAAAFDVAFTAPDGNTTRITLTPTERLH